MELLWEHTEARCESSRRGREGAWDLICERDGFLPSSSSVGDPFLPVSWLLFTGPLRKCFDNNSFLFNVN